MNTEAMTPKMTCASLPAAVVEHYIKCSPPPLDVESRDFVQWLNKLADLDGYYISVVNGFSTPGRFIERQKQYYLHEQAEKESKRNQLENRVFADSFAEYKHFREIIRAKILPPTWLTLHIPAYVDEVRAYDPNYRYLTTQELDLRYKDDESVTIEYLTGHDSPLWNPVIGNDTSDHKFLFRVPITTPWPQQTP